MLGCTNAVFLQMARIQQSMSSQGPQLLPAHLVLLVKARVPGLADPSAAGGLGIHFLDKVLRVVLPRTQTLHLCVCVCMHVCVCVCVHVCVYAVYMCVRQ